MADVAKRAAVSSQTVSRVVRGQTNVSEVTRLKVELAIDELGYRRTGIARALVTGHTMTLGVLTQGSVAYSRAAYVAAMTSMLSRKRQEGYLLSYLVAPRARRCRMTSRTALGTTRCASTRSG